MADKSKAQSTQSNDDETLAPDEAQVEEHVQAGEELYDPATGTTIGPPVEPFEPLSEPMRDHDVSVGDDPGDTAQALPPASPAED